MYFKGSQAWVVIFTIRIINRNKCVEACSLMVCHGKKTSLW